MYSLIGCSRRLTRTTYTSNFYTVLDKSKFDAPILKQNNAILTFKKEKEKSELERKLWEMAEEYEEEE